MSHAKSAERVVRDIQRKTRRRFSAEEKIRIVLEGLRGEESIATELFVFIAAAVALWARRPWLARHARRLA